MSLEVFLYIVGLFESPFIFIYQDFFVKISNIWFLVLLFNVLGLITYGISLMSNLMNTFYIGLSIFINLFTLLGTFKNMVVILNLFIIPKIYFLLSFLLVPLEIISYTFKLVSLSVRLFSNMMAGHILLHIISGFS
jgi:F0F1-type ATP synthase membrane subunit a